MSKKKIKKKNPNKKHATEADVIKAKKQATYEAMERVLMLVLYVLVDKHDAPREDIQQLANEVNYMADSVSKGYVSWRDIENVLLDEYEIELDLH